MRPRLHPAARLGATASLLLCLSACGSSPAPGPATGDGPSPSSSPLGVVIPPAHDFGDACRLLTTMEVQAAAGGLPVTATPRTDPQSGSYCDYMQATRYGGGSLLLSVQVSVHGSASEARDVVDQLGGSPVQGIGDVARVQVQQGVSIAVHVAHGATLAAVSTFDRIPQQVLVRLAALVGGRL